MFSNFSVLQYISGCFSAWQNLDAAGAVVPDVGLRLYSKATLTRPRCRKLRGQGRGIIKWAAS